MVDKEQALKLAKELMVAGMEHKLISLPSATVAGRDAARDLGEMLDELVTRIMIIQDKDFIRPTP